MPREPDGRGPRRGRPFRLPPVAPLVRVGAVGLAFILAVWGFGDTYARLGRPPSLVEDISNAAQLIVGQYPDDLKGQPVSWGLTLARWALPLLTFWSTVALGWVQVRNPLRLALIRARGEHLVIAGDAGLARQAAEGELAHGRRVLLWCGEAGADWIGDAVERGAAEVPAKGETLAVERLGLDKARGVLLLAADDSGNTALASRVMAQAGQGRPPGDPLNVIARIDHLDLRRSVEERFDRVDRSAARIRFASLPDIAARELFVDRPLDRFRRLDDGGRRVFLFGFSATIERYLLRMLAGGHFRDGIKPHFVVVDPRGAANAATFHARNPGADKLSPIRFETGPIDQATPAAAMIERLTERHGAPTAIVIDCEDDAQSLALALAIDDNYSRLGLLGPPIYTHLASRPDERLGVAIFAFGGFDRVADPDMLLQEKHDALARSIHDFYLEGRLDEGDRIGSRGSMREWEDLSESFRDDNRLVADCYQLKLRDIGARLVRDPGPALRFADDELEELARAEHDRWMAAKLATGWVHGATRDDAARVHPDIVPYDALSERIKDLDREQIRVMTRLLGASGQRAVRVLTVALRPDSVAGLARGLPQVLTRLAEQYPDRAPVVSGWLDDAASRDALQVAAAAGCRVQILLSGNAQSLIDGLPTAERGAAWQLVRGADVVLACQSHRDARAAVLRDADILLATAPAPDVSCPVVVMDAAGIVRQAPWAQ